MTIPAKCLIRSLGYLGLRSNKIDVWRSFAATVLGMQVIDGDDGRIMLRMDNKAQRYIIAPAAASELGFMGFEVASEVELGMLVDTLTQAGIAIHQGSAEERRIRHVDRMVWANDPDGNRVEFFCGLQENLGPLVPGKPIGGFRTGDLGMGHIVLYTPNYDAMNAFYLSLLNFRLTDYHHEPFPIEFLRVNARHHSLALLSDPEGPPRIHHIMLEYRYWDDVGRAYDIALATPDSIAVSLGRHFNDHMTSFYMWTPDDFFIEIGWAGRSIDEASWIPAEVPSPSLWGHVRYWQTPEKRAETRELIAAIAAQGVRAPVSAWGDGPFTPPPKRPSGGAE